MTTVGMLVLLAGIQFILSGFAQRFESAESAVTIRHEDVPSDLTDYVYYAAEGSSQTFAKEHVDQFVENLTVVLLSSAEQSGSFTVTPIVAFVSDSNLVAVGAEPPMYVLSLQMYGGNVWEPHAYMIPGFLGALTMLGGLFWLAARWHVTQPDRRREIDERRV